MINPAYIPPPPEQLDFDRLRAQALSRLQAFAGDRWTDYNAHDPGLTLLEALCYALTDLAYRAGYSMPDLLAGEEGSFFSAAQALPGAPLSHSDLLRQLYALSGAAQVRLDALQAGEQQPELFYYPYGEKTGAIGMEFFPGAERIALQGLYRLSIGNRPWPNAAAADSEPLLRFLHTMRGLCTDFDEEAPSLSPEMIPLYLTLDIAPGVADAKGFAADLLIRLAQQITHLPRVQAAGEKPEGLPGEVWQELPLEKGYLDPEELERLRPRDALYASDIVQWLMDQPGVDNVRRIAFEENTSVLVKLLSPDKIPALHIDSTAAHLKLLQSERKLDLDAEALKDTVSCALSHLAAAAPSPLPALPAVSAGRNRRVGQYHSIRHDLPALYGLAFGTEGLSAEQAARRRQLSAYLLFFEQALAGQFAQLDHGRRLFDLKQGSPPQTYARPALADIPQAAEVLLAGYAGAPESAALSTRRRQRLYDHLLARVGEQVYVTEPAQKLHFLQHWPQWSARRGLGFDKNSDGPSDLEARIMARLGLTDAERFYLVEHLLLRPLPDDQPDDEGNWLTRAPRPDPYSLRVTCVLPREGGRFEKDEDFRQFVCRVIREEVPAHIAIDWLWLNADRMDKMGAAWARFRARPAGTNTVLERRIYRDAVLDELRHESSAPSFLIGWPAPLLEIPARQLGFAEPGGTARIQLAYSQPGAIYILCDRNGNMLVKEDGGIALEIYMAITETGTGGPLTLVTPWLGEEDDTFCIKVIKLLPGVDMQEELTDENHRSGFLRRKVRVRVGIQTNLTLRWLPEGTTVLSYPLMIPYDAPAGVRIESVQAEVAYFLINDSGEILSNEQGTFGTEGGNVDIFTRPLQDDVRLRVLARRTVAGESGSDEQVFEKIINQQAEEGWIFVGANPDIDFGVIGPVAYGGTARPFLRQTQPNVQYSLQYREVVDAEFIHQQGLQTSGGVWHDLPQNLPPALLRRNDNNYGWLIQNAATLDGNGSDISADVENVREDTWFFVNAEKTHQGPHGPVLGNMVSLRRVPLAFVYPNKDLVFPQEEVTLSAGERLEIPLSNPQPGVFYRLVNLDDNNAPLGPEVYCHDTGLTSPRRDGIGLMDLQYYSNSLPAQLGSKVGVDFVVGPPQSGENLIIGSDSLPAEPAQLKVGVLARKAQTGLWVLLEGSFTLRIEGGSSARLAAAPDTEPPQPPTTRRRRNNNDT